MSLFSGLIGAAPSGGLSIGSSIVGGTSGSVIYIDSSGKLAQDNSNFFWDATNKRLGLGTASPGENLTVFGTNAKSIIGDDTIHTSQYTVFDTQNWTMLELVRTSTASLSGATALAFTANIASPDTTNDIVGTLVFVNRQLSSAERRMGMISLGYDALNSGRFDFWTMNAGSLSKKMTLSAAGFLGINKTSSIGAQLHVVPSSAGTIGQIIQLAASPTAAAFQLQDSTGTPQLNIDASFRLRTASGGLSITRTDSFTDVTNPANAIGYIRYEATNGIHYTSSPTGGAGTYLNMRANVLNLGSGTISFPAVTWGDATNNGMWFSGADKVGISASGLEVVRWSDQTAQAQLLTIQTASIKGSIIKGAASQTGILCQLQGISSTSTAREQADIDTAWIDSTDATRKSRLIFRAWDTAAREGIRIDASGSVAKLGFFGTAAVVQQTDGAALTNNAVASGTTNQIDDFTSLTVYATDAQAIHNDIYQLARKVKIIDDALRNYGLLT